MQVAKPKLKEIATATLTLSVSGLVDGECSVDVTLKNGAEAHVGDFTIDTTAPAPIVMPIPPEVDSLNIRSLSISDGALTILLEGEAALSVDDWNYIGNVRVTGFDTPAAGSIRGEKGKPVHGHAVSHSVTDNNWERRRYFLWVAFGAPRDTELTVNVDGVVAGTISSTSQGKVTFEGLPDTLLLPTIQKIEITDPAGSVVMQALF